MPGLHRHSFPTHEPAAQTRRRGTIVSWSSLSSGPLGTRQRAPRCPACHDRLQGPSVAGSLQPDVATGPFSLPEFFLRGFCLGSLDAYARAGVVRCQDAPRARMPYECSLHIHVQLPSQEMQPISPRPLGGLARRIAHLAARHGISESPIIKKYLVRRYPHTLLSSGAQPPRAVRRVIHII